MSITIGTNLELHELRWTPIDVAGRRSELARYRIQGQESTPPLADTAAVLARRNALLGLPVDEVLAVTADAGLEDAAGLGALTGFYRLLGVRVALRSHPDSPIAGEDAAALDWALDLERVGGPRTELESRLTGATRSNAHPTTSGGGERWHAPPPGASAVGYAADSPGTVSRTLLNGGTIDVYRALSDATPARYSATPADLQAEGNLAVTTLGYPVLGDLTSQAASGGPTYIDNGLVRIGYDPNDVDQFTLDIADGAGAWEDTYPVRIRAAAATLSAAGAYLVRWAPHIAVLRLVYDVTPRVELDVTLRRGAHHIAWTIRAGSAVNLDIQVNDSGGVTSADLGGWVARTANDAAGHRWMIGTADTIAVADAAPWRGIRGATTTAFSGMIGYEVAGSTAVSGDDQADVFAQWIEDRAELVRALR